MNTYDRAFYENRHKKTRKAAELVLNGVWPYVHPRSVIDVGCGVGTWLQVAKDLGAHEVLGYDGDWVPRDALEIEQREFAACDLQELPPIQRRYDLAISLEVAEHLPARSGAVLVRRLCDASDVVLFSAAIPGQGGRGHINEQWQSYWTELFEDLGFLAVDLIRPMIWKRADVAFWYRQNLLVYVQRKSEIARNFAEAAERSPLPTDLVHPELWRRGPAGGGRKAAADLLTALRRRLGSMTQL